MPLIYQHSINSNTRIGLWQMEEPESFFATAHMQAPPALHPQRRLQYLSARHLLTQLYADFPVHRIEVSPAGKPFLPCGTYDFSLTHAAHYAASIVSSSQRVGIDAEIASPRIFKVQHKFMHADELELLHTMHAMLPQQTLLTLCWSVKEALFKWYGLGQVNFQEHLRILRIEGDALSGTIAARVAKGAGVEVCLHYRLFDQLVLCWAISER